MGSTPDTGDSDGTLTRADHDATDTSVESPTVLVPVVLPQVVVTVDDTGRARIAVEHIDRRAIDCPDGPISRDELGTVLARIAEQVGGPVRVEVREPDGARYADILQPRPPEPKPDTEPKEPDAGPLLRGEGFLPDETVLVAVVVVTVQAQVDGTASVTALPGQARSDREVILFGGASGHVVQRHAPTSPAGRPRRWWQR